MAGSRPRYLLPAVLAALVVGAIGLGLSLRLEDPTSTEVVPAEDPYTHMALVREHLRDGTLDPLNQPGTLYPPGMHALVAAVVAYTGADLYEVTRLGPAFIGALGLVGIALLVSRFDGLGTALGAVLALAIVPEAIFRTTMLSPTALDLALLPFLAYSVLELLRGKLAWAGPVAALSGFLLFSHPWVFGILGVAGLAFLLLVTLMPWPSKLGSLPTAWGVVCTVAIVGSSLALSLSGCWGGCGPGFRDVLGAGQTGIMDNLSIGVLLLSVAPLATKALAPRAFRSLFPTRRAAMPFAARLIVSQLLLIGVVATVIVSKRGGWPPQVDLAVMAGWPLLVIGALGLAALPFRPTPAAHFGAALALGTLPFVVFDPFDSPFWSHRTAVYFVLGLAILCGVAFSAAVQGALAASRRLATPAAGGKAAQRSPGTMAALAATGILVLLAVAGGAYAATPEPYKGGWYRLYEECEFGALRETAELADEEPRLLLISATWQSKLVMSALADDASRMWYKPDFFTSAAERDDVIEMLESEGRPLVVVVDPLVAQEHPEIDASFLDSDPWTPVDQWCGGSADASGPGTVRAYTLAR
jgi:hypothetical protein